MREGWCNDDYWCLCESQDEAKHLTASYGLAEYLPGFFIVALKSWDDFALSDEEGQYFLVPTVPLGQASLTPFRFPAGPMQLRSDDRLTNKIRWFIQPIKFGGNPSSKENTAWLSQEEHIQVVKWWNQFYRDTFGKQKKL